MCTWRDILNAHTKLPSFSFHVYHLDQSDSGITTKLLLIYRLAQNFDGY